jgi:predicted HicB family RNase H-like nuclease
MIMATNELVYKDYTGSVEPSVEDECLHGRILFIDDLVIYEGQTIPEILAAFESAVDRYLAHCERVGKAANRPYSGTFNVRIGSDLHGKAAKLASRKGVKLNEFVRQAVQDAVDRNEVARHHHRHDISVSVRSAEERLLTGVAVASGQGVWEKASVH